MAKLKNKIGNRFYLPRSIFSDDRLTPSDITVLSYLYSNLDQNKKHSNVSYSDIVKGASISRPTVSKSLKNLEKTGWVEIQRSEKNGPKNINKYILKIPKEVREYEN
jgi:DNA-binding MarR family transcriptional regulator